ncbi:MAG: hypothetical protein ACFFKA_21740 [Candidatus Thorarchaeota archaeon]
MKKQTKYILLALVGISSFTILFIINFSIYKTPQTLATVENISLIVDYNNGTLKERYNFTLEGGKTTAFDALDKWCDIEYDVSSLGIKVNVIDSVGGSWIYMINGFSPGVGAAVCPLKDGDLVKWQRLG